MRNPIRKRIDIALLLAVLASLAAAGLFLFLPSDSLDINVVYRGF